MKTYSLHSKPLAKIAFAFALIGVCQAPAAVLFQNNFDGNGSSFNQGEANAFNIPLSIVATTDSGNTLGVGGSNAFGVTFRIGVDPGDGGFARPTNEMVTGSYLVPATGNNLSDYTVSFDIRLDRNILAGGIFSFTADVADFSMRPIVEVPFTSSVGNTFTHMTLNLGNGTLVNGAANFSAATINANQGQFRFIFTNAQNSFGYETDTQVVVDNVVFEQVPEPSAAMLLAGAAGVLIVMRKRR